MRSIVLIIIGRDLMRYTRLLPLLILLCLGMMTAQAQDAAPTNAVPTVAVGGGGSSNVPGLGTTPFATVTATTEAEIGSTPGTEAFVTPTPGAGSSSLPATQSETTRICPALVEYQAVPVVCDSLVTNEACVGQGTVNASPLTESADFSFSQ